MENNSGIILQEAKPQTVRVGKEPPSAQGLAAKPKVFLAHSGVRSRHVAEALSNWLNAASNPNLCWFSKNDIAGGSEWPDAVMKALREATAGILCLTPENLRSPWLQFEAGALQRTLYGKEDVRVVPFLLEEIEPNTIPSTFTLGNRQTVYAFDQNAVIRMGKEILERCNVTLSEQMTKRLVDNWPALEGFFSNAKATPKFDPNDDPLDQEWFMSSHSRDVARDFNQHSKGGPASRFFGEIMIHRLRLHDTNHHDDGFTILRHAEDIQGKNHDHLLERKLLEIMSKDYEAIFQAAKASHAASTARRTHPKPTFDTIIFRDLELWAKQTYWESNLNWTRDTRLRRLFFYEKEMFSPGPDGKLQSNQCEELLGLFTGTLIHRDESWSYIVLNIVDLPYDLQLNLLGEGVDPMTKKRSLRPDLCGRRGGAEQRPGEEQLQSCAAIDGHTAVWVKWIGNNTLVHRFYNNPPNAPYGKVGYFLEAFEVAASIRTRPIIPQDLLDHLCQQYTNVADEIKKIFEEALKREEIYLRQKPKWGDARA